MAGAPRMRQAGTLRMDLHEHGVLDQMTEWRAGDEGAWTIDGSAARDNKKQPTGDIQHQAAWRFGDTGAFSFDDAEASAADQSPTHMRPGGVGRKVHSSILPHNDGSQLAMQSGVTEQRDRERRDLRAYQLVHNSGGLGVEDIPREVREKAQLLKLETADQLGIYREQLWDKMPFALDCTDRPEHTRPANPSRKRTDVTAGFPVSAADHSRAAADRLQLQADRAPSTGWRAGDDLPFTLDGTPARAHLNHFDPNQGMWRQGDTRPFRIDGTVPADDRASTRAEHREYNARRHTDIMYHKAPQLADLRHLAQLGVLGVDAQKGTIDDLYNGAAQQRFGPQAAMLANGVSDLCNAGLSWAEMRRRGHMMPSKSESALPDRMTIYGGPTS